MWRNHLKRLIEKWRNDQSLPDDKSKEIEKKQEFGLYFNYNHWLNSSDESMYCAEVLIEKLKSIMDKKTPDSSLILTIDSPKEITILVGLLENIHMLIGFALENALKAYSIFQYLKEEQELDYPDFKFLEEKVWKVKDGHNITQIAENIIPNLKLEEKELIEEMEIHIKWKGKYHMPKKTSIIKEMMNKGRNQKYSMDVLEKATTFIEKIKENMKFNP